MRSSASLLGEAFIKDRAYSPRHPKENPKKNLKLKQLAKLEFCYSTHRTFLHEKYSLHNAYTISLILSKESTVYVGFTFRSVCSS